MSLITTLLYPKPAQRVPLLNPGESRGNLRHITFEVEKPDPTDEPEPAAKPAHWVKRSLMMENHLAGLKKAGQIIAALERHGPQSRMMLVAMVGIKDSAVLYHLRRLIKEGRVIFRDSRGARNGYSRVYMIPGRGEK